MGVGWAERVMSKRENGKEEEHLAWPGYLGKIAESVGDFLLCFLLWLLCSPVVYVETTCVMSEDGLASD